MSRRRARAWSALAAALALSSPALRAGAEALTLELRGCAALSEAALREHLALELATLELSHVDGRLEIRCESGAAAIELTRASGLRFPVEVHVDLRDTARGARERLIALAATELVAQAERGRVAAQEASPAPTPARSAAESARPTPERDRAPADTSQRRRRYSELFLASSVAVDGQPKTTLWGASLGTLLGLAPHWSLLLDTRFERGAAQAELASVRWSLLSGFAGPQLRAELGWLRPALGFGVRAGWLSLKAEAVAPNEGRSLTAPWAGLALPVRVGVELGAGVVPFVGAEYGYVIVPVRGNVDDGSSLVEQRGSWLAANIGVGLQL